MDTTVAFVVIMVVLIITPPTVLGLLIQGAREIWVDDDPLEGAITFFLASLVFWGAVIIVLALR